MGETYTDCSDQDYYSFIMKTISEFEAVTIFLHIYEF